MAGLAELLLGKSNPFAQFINENQNKVHAAFGGLGSGTNFNEGLSRAAQGASLASPLDQAAAEKRQLAEESITARNKTVAYLRSQPGGAQFADAIENGMIDGSTAFKSWMDASKGPDPKPPIKLGAGETLYDPTTYQPIISGPPDGKEAFNREKDLSAQYLGTDPVKTYQGVRNGYEKIKASAALDSGPGDISTIFAYMKMLDPTSVVREGEFATAANAGGVGEQITGLYNRLLNGERLTPELRKQFLAAADQLYRETAQNLSDINAQYSSRASGWGVDPSRFVISPESYGADDPLNIRGP